MKYYKNTIESCNFTKSTQTVDRHVENHVDVMDTVTRLTVNSTRLHKLTAQEFYHKVICYGSRLIVEEENCTGIYKFLTCLSCCANS